MSGRSATADIGSLVRPHLRRLEPYRTARFRHAGGILLDANENGLGPPVADVGPRLHRYPDPANAALKEGISELTGAERNRIWVGNGSDEAIDLLVRVLVAPGERVVIVSPSYGVYAARAAVHAAEIHEVRLDDTFDLALERTARLARDAKLVFLCSPNNPTGNLLAEDRILALTEHCRALVAVDEAYIEFAARPSLARRAGGGPAGLPRLAVIRTFSKAWGLAGARAGYLVGAPELVDCLHRAGLPYPLSSPSARAARRALGRRREMERRVRTLRSERRRLRDALDSLGLDVLPSEANFLLFFLPESGPAPGAVQRALAARHGVVIRDRSGLPGLAGALRVTIGAPAENDRFLAGLESVLAEGSGEGDVP